jgi:hypothetical protein
MKGRVKHQPETIERAAQAYSLRPCDYKDAGHGLPDGYRDKREFARRLAGNAGMPATPALVDAIVKEINKNE